MQSAAENLSIVFFDLSIFISDLRFFFFADQLFKVVSL